MREYFATWDITDCATWVVPSTSGNSSRPSVPSDFPPLQSLDNPELPNNLPELLSSFVGRDEELDEVRTLIDEHRLVTLTGAGGSGKTRLAMQAAAELLDGQGEGVWLVELAPVNDEEWCRSRSRRSSASKTCWTSRRWRR